MSIYEQHTKSYSGSNESQEIYSYPGNQVVIITIFKTGSDAVAIVKDINTGGQYEVFKNQLY